MKKLGQIYYYGGKEPVIFSKYGEVTGKARVKCISRKGSPFITVNTDDLKEKPNSKPQKKPNLFPDMEECPSCGTYKNNFERDLPCPGCDESYKEKPMKTFNEYYEIKLNEDISEKYYGLVQQIIYSKFPELEKARPISNEEEFKKYLKEIELYIKRKIIKIKELTKIKDINPVEVTKALNILKVLNGFLDPKKQPFIGKLDKRSTFRDYKDELEAINIKTFLLDKVIDPELRSEISKFLNPQKTEEEKAELERQRLFGKDYKQHDFDPKMDAFKAKLLGK